MKALNERQDSPSMGSINDVIEATSHREDFPAGSIDDVIDAKRHREDFPSIGSSNDVMDAKRKRGDSLSTGSINDVIDVKKHREDMPSACSINGVMAAQEDREDYPFVGCSNDVTNALRYTSKDSPSVSPGCSPQGPSSVIERETHTNTEQFNIVSELKQVTDLATNSNEQHSNITECGDEDCKVQSGKNPNPGMYRSTLIMEHCNIKIAVYSCANYLLYWIKIFLIYYRLLTVSVTDPGGKPRGGGEPSPGPLSWKDSHQTRQLLLALHLQNFWIGQWLYRLGKVMFS